LNPFATRCAYADVPVPCPKWKFVVAVVAFEPEALL
jgi:hypothetical protein